MELGTTEEFLDQNLHVVPSGGLGVSVTPRTATPRSASSPATPRAIARTIYPPSPSLFFLKTKLRGIQPCSVQLLDKRDLSSLVSSTLPPNPLCLSLKSSTGNICRKAQTAEGGRGGVISTGKELHNEPAEQSRRQGRFPQQALCCPGNRVLDENPSWSYPISAAQR